MRYDGTETRDIATEISLTYGEIFSQPPWNRAHDGDPEVVALGFRPRLDDDMKRPGFRAIVARSETGIEGFATGWITPEPYPETRAYPKVAASIGAEAVRRLLVGAIEVDELAVRPEARGQGLARRLLGELIADAPNGRAWLLTWTGAPDAVEFYRRIGWHRVPVVAGCANDIVTYLAPEHPGAAELG